MTTSLYPVRCEDSFIGAACTVNAIVAKTPSALGVLNSFGIDTCCGGQWSLGDASALAHIDLAVVIAALTAAEAAEAAEGSPIARVLPQASSCSCGCR